MSVLMALLAVCMAVMSAGFVEASTLDSLSLITIAPLPLVLFLWKDVLIASQRFLEWVSSRGKQHFIIVKPALCNAELQLCIRERRSALVAMILPISGIIDINLTPKLLPIPRPHMGAAF